MVVHKRRAMMAVAITTVALVLAGAGAAIAAATFKSGTSVTRVTVSTENAPTIHTGAAWVTLRTSSVFAGAGGFVVATFTAESACYGGSGWCAVRILVDGVEAEPVAGTDFAFDSTDGNRETAASWESHSVQRTRAVTTTASHSITVQVAQVGAGVTARYDDWTLTGWAVAP